MHIGNSDISIKEYNGQRVVTFKDIDMVHGRPDGTARKRFNDNRNHFIEGEDFFVITQPSEIRTLGLERPQGGVPEKVILATEQGYLMLVKSFTDDLAWDVQRQLVNGYFKTKETVKRALSPELQMLQGLLSQMVEKELADKERDRQILIAKETADVILLDKDLMVLEKGLVEGRKVYANMTKYIKMTVSSNFGNIFSLLFASIFLPFLPMAPVHLIVLNLVYDISCIALPFDNVDKEFLKEPHIWEAKSIMRFMAWFGPISSVFDILTYTLLYFIIVPMILGHGYVHGSPEAAAFIIIFQTGWFIESMWSQTMVIHMLRSPKLPFIQSHPALSVVVTTLFAAVFVTSLPYSPLASLLKLSHLNGLYFILLFIIIVLYMLSVTFVKHIYIKKYKEWL